MIFKLSTLRNSGLLKKIVHGDSASQKKCWPAEILEACEGLSASDRCTDCVKAAIPLSLQDFVVNLHEQFVCGMGVIGWLRP